MPTLPVGPTRTLKTLDAAYAAAVNGRGDTIALDPGEYRTAGFDWLKGGITLASSDPANPAIVRGTANRPLLKMMSAMVGGFTVHAVRLGSFGANPCIRNLNAKDVTVDNAPPVPGTRWWIQGTGQNMRIVNTTVPKIDDGVRGSPSGYAISNLDMDSHGLVIDNVIFEGAGEDDHVMRLSKMVGAVIRNCEIHGVGARSALSLRAARDCVVEDTKIYGRVIFGPLGDNDGGVKTTLVNGVPTYTLVSADDVAKVNVNTVVRRVTIETDGITAGMNTQNLRLEDVTIASTNSSPITLEHEEAYAKFGRTTATGLLLNTTMTGPAGMRPFRQSRDGFGVRNLTVNGTKQPDTTPAGEPVPDPELVKLRQDLSVATARVAELTAAHATLTAQNGELAEQVRVRDGKLAQIRALAGGV